VTYTLSEDFMRCAAFHGHICPGLAMGYRAARAALDYLKAQRSIDDEIVAITETDACSVDAIQVLTGCTLGKGNLILRDYGKMVCYFLSRNSGKGVRLAARPTRLERPGQGHEVAPERIELSYEGAYPEFKPEVTKEILELPIEKIFDIRDVEMEIPLRAKIEISEICEVCREPVMPSKVLLFEGCRVCAECAKAGTRAGQDGSECPAVS